MLNGALSPDPSTPSVVLNKYGNTCLLMVMGKRVLGGAVEGQEIIPMAWALQFVFDYVKVSDINHQGGKSQEHDYEKSS
jgi:hypothetical protein